MSAISKVIVTCNGCGMQVESSAKLPFVVSPERYNQRLEIYGWFIVQDAHYCPLCAPEAKARLDAEIAKAKEG